MHSLALLRRFFRGLRARQCSETSDGRNPQQFVSGEAL